ncbi:IS3 family transposase [Kitasatospora sp. NBC_00240]|uniref:IS3 family transposase n=1 Tax=Kitasatospora sp. NBC_00240 TaxID=2903567 RepID=UPI002254DCB5|nr:IS3 family transposase [Kitasatospora sp. NBC_00240]MCX5215564.1 IS3 family transposase [Kitasatospora sp. NBC_00240]
MIDHLRDGFGVDPVCRVLDLSPSTYFARKTRPKSARQLRDEELIALVTAVWEDSGRTYGARRITRALVRAGHEVARCTVERLMRELGIEGVIRGRRRRTTIPEPAAPRPPDLVNRRFTADRPNQLWLADLTYVRTWSGWVYVAFVLDAHSRRIVGWQIADHMRTDLPLDALEMALWRQKIKKDAELIHHSDRGSQGGFNWSSQHLDHGGLRWDGASGRRCQRECDVSGRRIGRCDRRCVRRGGRSRLVQCSATSGGGSRRE